MGIKIAENAEVEILLSDSKDFSWVHRGFICPAN